MARYSVNNYTVDVLLADIKSGNIAIPEMQRPFVWDATQVRDLMDSLYKGFPVGYIIVWQIPQIKKAVNGFRILQKCWMCPLVLFLL